MPETDALHTTTALRETLNREVVELVRALRCSHPPDDVLRAAIEEVRAAHENLNPFLVEGEGWSTLAVAGVNTHIPWTAEDITAVMPYSPISGKQNPLAAPLKMWQDGDEVRGEVVFSPTYAGPPDSVHGGIIAAVFDEVLAMANVVAGAAGFTGTLTVKYHRKTPINTPVELWSKNVRNSGRKQICEGEMRVDGEVTASAEGLFIAPEESSSRDLREG